MRKLLRTRRGGLFAVTLAYALAVQALMASVGLGMSAFAASGQDSFVICRHVSAPPQSPADRDQNSGSAPRCPFCFVAAHSAGNSALPGGALAFPAYAGLPAAMPSGHAGKPAFVAQHYRTVGAPRAPPVLAI